jgi:transcriptional regulator with XRE-family HTH domain
MDDPEIIGARIRKARKDKGLTQVELAAAMGVSRAHLTNVEGGNGGLALDKLSVLARETGTTVAWLIGEGASLPTDQARADLLAAYEAMDAEQRRALLIMAKAAVRRDTVEQPCPERPERRGAARPFQDRRRSGS